MTEITFIIDKDGNVSIDVEGIQGTGCHDVIKVFQEALGVETKLNEKPAYFYELDGIKQTVGR